MALLAASAPQLRRLEHWYPYGAPANTAAAFPAVIGQLTRISSLTMGWGVAPVTTAQVNLLVPRLPSLQHLCLNGHKSLADGFPVSITSSCSQLRCLQIHCALLKAMPPELGHLTALTRLELGGCMTINLPDSISQLSRLAELDLGWFEALRVSLPRGLTACRHLTRLEMDSDAASPVLASLQSLRHLRVAFNEKQRETYWTQLTALTELQLRCQDESIVPAVLGGMASLCMLRIEDALCDDLPAGLYLSRLESLVMEDCSFPTGMPLALAAATQLQHIGICGDEDDGDGAWLDGTTYVPIDLDAHDIALISSLPALTTLSLKQPDSIDDCEWGARLAQLRAAFSAQGRVPPAVARCMC